MITEAEKEIKGFVEIELISGKQYIKFTNRANQVIWEKTGKTIAEYLQEIYVKATKNIKNKKTEAGMIEMVAKALSPGEVSLLLFCGLLHTKKYNSIEELEEDMYLEKYYVYVGAIVIATGKLLTDFLTLGQNTAEQVRD